MPPKRSVVALTQTRPRGKLAAMSGLFDRMPVVRKFGSGALSRPGVTSMRDVRLVQLISFGFLVFCLVSPVHSFTVRCTSSGPARDVDSRSVRDSDPSVPRRPGSEMLDAKCGIRRSDGDRCPSAPANRRKRLLPMSMLDCIRRRIAMTSFVCRRRLLSAVAFIACRHTKRRQ